MNYFLLKNIIETTIAHFTCKDCQGKVTEDCVTILGTAGNTLNLEIVCPKCKTSGIVKAEVNIMPDPRQAGEFIQHIKKIVHDHKNQTKIQDADIVKLHEEMGRISSVQDLFWL